MELSDEERRTIMDSEYYKSLAARQDELEALHLFCEDRLTRGFDYGEIPQGGDKKTKAALLLPGAEKIAFWLYVRPEYEPIGDPANTMIGIGTVAFRCRLFHGDVCVHEGTGAASIKEYTVSRNDSTPKSSAYHSIVTFAKKRAFVNAVKGYAALSARFTQDEDILLREARQRREARSARTQPANGPAGVASTAPGNRPQQINSSAAAGIYARRAKYRQLAAKSNLSDDALIDLIANVGGGLAYDKLSEDQLDRLCSSLEEYIGKRQR